MANIPVEGMDFIPTGGTLKRTLAAWTGDSINVLNFGADPTGVADSTSAIQAALDAAFGSITTFHNIGNAYLNKRVYLPAGTYKVAAPHPQATVTNITCDNSSGANFGHLTFTIGAHGYVQNDLIFILGPYDPADGGNDGNFQGLRRIASVTGTAVTTYEELVFHSAVLGGGAVTAHSVALSVTGVFGGVIKGDGPYATRIVNTTAGGICFSTNGFKVSKIQDIAFDSNSVGLSGCHIDLDGSPVGGGGATYPEGTIQGVTVDTVYNCRFINGRFGCMVGPTNNSQSDTILFLSCGFANNTEVDFANGLFFNFNAISQSFLGCKWETLTNGYFSNNATIGVWVGCTNGTINSHGSSNTPFVGGNQAEFGIFLTQANMSLISHNQTRAAQGYLLSTESACNVLGCYSNLGAVGYNHPGTSVRNSWFDLALPDAIDDTNPGFLQPIFVNNCLIGGSPFNGAFSEPNYIEGQFNLVGGVQYFLGEKRVPSGASNTLMKVADLPPVTTPFTSAKVVTVHDATVAQTSANKNSTVVGGGTNVVRVVNNGTNWVIV